MEKPAKLKRLKRQAASNLTKSKRLRVLRTEAHPAPLVAQFLFSPRHYLVATAISQSAPATTTFLVSMACRLNVEMTAFIVNDLVRANLAVVQDNMVSLQSRETVNDCIEGFPDSSLKEYIEMVAEEGKPRRG